MSVYNICRLCLYKTPTNVPLMRNNIRKMLEALTSIKIEPTDEILKICLKCRLRLTLAYNIQQDIINADQKLRNGYLNKLLTEQQSGLIIKSEDYVPNSNLNSVHLPSSVCIICNSDLDEYSNKLHYQQHFQYSQHCDLCNQAFSNIHSYREHLSKHPQHKEYQCTECEITFRYKSLYNVHMEMAHPEFCDSLEQTELEDNITTSTSDKINGFEKTEIESSIQEDATEDNKELNKDFLVVFLNEEPYELNTEENPILDHLDSTDKTYSSVIDIKMKSRTSRLRYLLNQPQHQKYKCDKCKATFRYKSLYNIHQTKVHPNDLSNSNSVARNRGKHKKRAKDKINKVQKENPRPKLAPSPVQVSPCEIKKTVQENGHCSQQFTDENTFPMHSHSQNHSPICDIPINTDHRVHYTNRRRVCEYCGHVFANTSSLASHRRYTHKKDGVYECKRCQTTFESGLKLRRHQKHEHRGPAKVCETCGKKFALDRQLQQHIAVHTKERPHICEICKRGFPRRYTLDRHKRQHTNETPYKCEECGDGFKHNVSLKAHRKSKHDIVEEVTSSCEMCGKGFSSEHALKTHTRRKH